VRRRPAAAPSDLGAAQCGPAGRRATDTQHRGCRPARRWPGTAGAAESPLALALAPPLPCRRRCVCEWLQRDAVSEGLAAAATTGASAAVRAAAASQRHEVGAAAPALGAVLAPLRTSRAVGRTGCKSTHDASLPHNTRVSISTHGTRDTKHNQYIPSFTSFPPQVLEAILPESGADTLALLLAHAAAGARHRFAATQIARVAASCVVGGARGGGATPVRLPGAA
jgi:hypothetical protein